MSYSDQPRLAAQIERARVALLDPRAFLALLTNPDADQAAGAALVLRRETVEGAAIHAIVEVGRNATGELRRIALRRLQWVQDPAVLTCMLEALKDADERVCNLALDGLGSQKGEAAVQALGSALKTPPTGFSVSSIVRSLVKSAGERAIPMLVDAFRAGVDPLPLLESLAKLRAVTALSELFAGAVGPARVPVLRAIADIREPAPVALLQRALRDTDGAVRVVAASGLAWIFVSGQGSGTWLRDSVLALAGALDDPQGSVREKAADTLGRLAARNKYLKEGGTSLAEALLDALPRASVQAKRPLLGLLAQIGAARVTDELAACLHDADAGARLDAAQAVAQSTDARAGPALLALAGDGDAAIRALVARSIGPLEGNDYDVALDRAALDAAGEVRAAAVHALGRRRGKAAVPLLLRALSDQELAVRKAAVEAIAPFGELAAVPLILKSGCEAWPAREALDAVKDPSMIPYFVAALEGGSVVMKEYARQWLVNRCTLDAKPQLAALLEHRSEQVRKAAREALDRLPDPALVAELARRMAEEKSPERWKAVHVLWKIAGALPKESIIAQLSHPEPRVRRIFARFAGLLYGSEALPALGQLRTDADPSVRWWASVAMEQAGRPRSPWDRPLDGHIGFAPPPDGVDL